ncbi:two-component sensor histidine kinase [Nonomuraea sp. WAC 01424]|nr:two-component sensor histidine kinase [Nonomuraea sp. WAC 01424]
MAKRLFPRSIRGRLTTLATLVAAVVLAVTATLTLTLGPDNLHGLVETRVELAVRRVASEARAGQLSPTLEAPARVQLLQVVSADGRVIASSPGLRGQRLTGIQVDKPETIYSTESTLTGLRDEKEAQYLIMAIQVHTPSGELVTVYGASSLSDVNRALSWLNAMVFLGTPMVLVIVAGITWVVVASALRPVERIRAELAEITGRDLSRRVSVSDTGDEITDLAATTNHTLDRLERSAETQRRFVADASHELRSPISALRTQLEVANSYPDETDWPATGARALAAAERLTGIIDELLMLARLDAGAIPDRRIVDLCRLAEAGVRRRAGGKIPIVLDTCGRALVLGSPVQLDRLLTNLLDNATRHAASRIDLRIWVEGDHVYISVTDDGDGIPPEDRERVFERFTRLEAARRKEKGGSGLGLPLSREICASHGGTLKVADHSPGARLIARLPLHRA